MRALGSLVLCTLAIGALASTADLHLSPLLLWSNQGIVGTGSGSQVQYKVLGDVEHATSNAILGLLGQHEEASDLLRVASSEHAPAIVIFAGSQLAAADLRKGSAGKLNDVLGSAVSSLVLPFTSGKSQSHSGLSHALEKAGLRVKAVGCAKASDDPIRDVVETLTSEDSAQVVVVCPQLDWELSHSPEGLQQELDQLLSIQEAVDATELPHLFIYTSHKQEPKQRRRILDASSANASSSMLTGFGPYTTCGTLCQTQVRWLEGLLAVVFLALTICAGMTCLNVLNTPTRFEVVKEGM